MDASSPRFSTIICIGSGFSSLAVVGRAQLTYNISDFHIYERAPAAGGTWQANAYPGAACDVPGALYSLSFAQNPEWSSMMPPQPEILAYSTEVAERLNVPAHTSLGTEVLSAAWDSYSSRWVVGVRDLATGLQWAHECRLLFATTGALAIPSVPNVDGRFSGKAFHSAQWPQGLDLCGKRVAVVGNGCSAAQIVPAILGEVESVTQFIRERNYVQAPPTIPVTPTLKWVLRNVPLMMKLLRLIVFVMAESGVWIQWNSLAWMRKRHQAKVKAFMRGKLPERYHEMLIPDYEIGCKVSSSAPCDHSSSRELTCAS